MENDSDIIEHNLRPSRIREYLSHMVKQEITIAETADSRLPDTIRKLGQISGEWFNAVGVEFVYGDVGSYIDSS